MNTEEKELLLKDLCARLLYGVKYEYHCPYDVENDRIGTIVGIDDANKSMFFDDVGGRVQIGKTSLPILFPIECLTKPITIAGETCVPMSSLLSIVLEQLYGKENSLDKGSDFFEAYEESGSYGCSIHIHPDHIFELCFTSGYFRASVDGVAVAFDQMPLIEWMHKHHINYRLPDHLFVPVTETFNPYAK